MRLIDILKELDFGLVYTFLTNNLFLSNPLPLHGPRYRFLYPILCISYIVCFLTTFASRLILPIDFYEPKIRTQKTFGIDYM